MLFVVGIFGLNEWHKAINFVSKTRLYRFHYIDMQKATEKKKQQAKKVAVIDDGVQTDHFDRIKNK